MGGAPRLRRFLRGRRTSRHVHLSGTIPCRPTRLNKITFPRGEIDDQPVESVDECRLLRHCRVVGGDLVSELFGHESHLLARLIQVTLRDVGQGWGCDHTQREDGNGR